jgi:hypothetical protein
MSTEEREEMLRKVGEIIFPQSKDPNVSVDSIVGYRELAQLVVDMDKRIKALEGEIVRYRKIDKEHNEVQ